MLTIQSLCLQPSNQREEREAKSQRLRETVAALSGDQLCWLQPIILYNIEL
jgi:hypothetical protein